MPSTNTLLSVAAAALTVATRFFAEAAASGDVAAASNALNNIDRVLDSTRRSLRGGEIESEFTKSMKTPEPSPFLTDTSVEEGEVMSLEEVEKAIAEAMKEQDHGRDLKAKKKATKKPSASKKPTNTPTTGFPTASTKKPTNTPTTGFPTASTKKPTNTPTTGFPTASTKKPTKTPTTGFPTASTKKPTNTPTTGFPTASTKKPTNTPTTAFPTPKPVIPSKAPTVKTQSPVTPSKSPTKPVVAPTSSSGYGKDVFQANGFCVEFPSIYFDTAASVATRTRHQQSLAKGLPSQVKRSDGMVFNAYYVQIRIKDPRSVAEASNNLEPLNIALPPGSLRDLQMKDIIAGREPRATVSGRLRF